MVTRIFLFPVALAQSWISGVIIQHSSWINEISSRNGNADISIPLFILARNTVTSNSTPSMDPGDPTLLQQAVLIINPRSYYKIESFPLHQRHLRLHFRIIPQQHSERLVLFRFIRN